MPLGLALAFGCPASTGQKAPATQPPSEEQLKEQKDKAATPMEINKIYSGFKLLRKKRIDEINATGLLFEHQKSGARLFKVVTDDDNKTFCITFKTPPNSDSGTPHILEHSVLEGSDAFPVKSPFMVMAKGSLNTFLNALTSNDHTMYPVASRNQKDFFNLMHVYLDAVFFPRVRKEEKIFRQEGWHYELDSVDGELTYSGVVYSEMKGAYSSPDRLLYQTILKGLYPDTVYRFSSGGEPQEIPELSYKDFLAFHKKYYHPSNAYIWLYGDGDIHEELAFIDQKYLSKFTRGESPATIPMQPAFSKIHDVEAEYPISMGEDEKGKTYLALSFVAGAADKPALSMALEMLADVLVNLPSSPIRKALEAAGIGKDAFATYWGLKQSMFAIVAKDANPKDKEKFKQVVFDTLKELVKKGIDKQMIQGVINRTEFQLREADYGSMPKGLVYNYFALSGWLFTDDPFLTLEYEGSLSEVKQALTSRYFEEIIKRYLLENKNGLFSVLKPKKGLEQEFVKEEKEKLAKIKAGLTKAEREALVQKTKELKRFQAQPDSPEDLAKLPMLSLKDLAVKAERIEAVQKMVEGTRVLAHHTFTNDIFYLMLMFDASVVPQDLIPYVPLLASVLGEVDTKEHTYEEITNQLNIHTGGVEFALDMYSDKDNVDQFYPKLMVTGKALQDSFPKLLGLEREMIQESKLSDVKRLKEVIQKLDSRLESEAKNNAVQVAGTRLVSYFTQRGRFQEVTEGLSYYKFVGNIAKRFDKLAPEVIDNLKRTAEIIFNRDNLIVGITCEEKDYPTFTRELAQFLKTLPAKKVPHQQYTFKPMPKNEALTAASKVQYVMQGANFRAAGHDYNGHYQVLSQILSRDYLYEKVRVQGGAYGAWAAFSSNGMAQFGSYRDPHLKKTLAVYADAVDYLKHFNASEKEMTRYIIGVIAKLDHPLTPAGRGNRAITDFLQRRTYADVQKERDEVLSTRKEDIRQMAGVIADILKPHNICVYGGEKKLAESKALFSRMVPVAD